MARKSVRVKKAHPHAAVANEIETLTGQEATAQQQAVSGVVVQAPSEGDLVHGELFTINGSGFGTRENYGPSGRLNWTQTGFESSLTEDGYVINAGAGTHWVRVTGSPRHARSAAYAKRQRDGNIQHLDKIGTFPSSGTEAFFFSAWVLPGSAHNGKTYRFRFGSEILPPGEDLWWNNGSGSVYSDSRSAYLAGHSSVGGNYITVPSGSWSRVDFLIQGKSGSYRQRIFIIGSSSNNARMDTSLSIPLGSTNAIWLGAGNDGNNDSTNWVGFDDVYGDFTQARVELANSATWSSVTYSEIQTPVEWSASSIQFRANAGAFTSGQTAHVHVFDASGVRQYWGPVGVA